VAVDADIGVLHFGVFHNASSPLFV